MARKKLIVIGGGAAGFFCAVNAAASNPLLDVLILEKSAKVLSKVRVSGGGRCNVTHSCFSISEMVKSYPRGQNFLKKAFHLFFTSDCIQWFSDRGVELKTESDGRMFPVSDSSESIIQCLLNEASRNNVDVRVQTSVISFYKEYNRWVIETSKERLTCDYICIACGGFPKADQFNWLAKSGHSILPPVPSLFTFNIPSNKITDLMGIAVEAGVKIAGTKLFQKGPLLITHWGLSGPAVLKLSAWGAKELAEMNYNFQIIVNWLPEYNENTLRTRLQDCRTEFSAKKVVNKNPFGLPSRLWEHFLFMVELSESTRWSELPAKDLNKLAKLISTSEYQVNGKTTFKEEFVTAGGVSTDEIEPSSMESRINKGLYFAGEILNIDGITGGFNFQNAWTTGWIAAKAIAGN